MTDRLEKIFSLIPYCEVFADIGCDHGYIANEMLKKDKCKKVIISDVSKKCLAKAESLLKEYIVSGRAMGVVSDGFDNLPEVDCALIAGMGGKEIISILSKEKDLPNNLILQPMKNLPEVRALVVERGYKILTDKIFFSEEKFYNILVCVKGADSLLEDELEFGRTNIIERSSDFKRYLANEITTLEKVLEEGRLSIDSKESIIKRLNRLKKYA